MSDIVSKMVEEYIKKNIDLSKYDKQIESAVKEYFIGGSFKENLGEMLYEANLEYEIAQSIAKQVASSLKKVKVNITF